MFNFIKKLFKKEQKTEAVVKTEESVVLPKIEYDEEYWSESRKTWEESRALAIKAEDLRRELGESLKRLGVVYKFMDLTTGEIYEVQPDDFETFDKMMVDKNTSIVYD